MNIHSDVHLILGPPGTGKTTTLLNISGRLLKETEANKLGFVTFTKKATKEAVERVSKKFPGTRFPYFKTLHSLAYFMLGIQRSQVMGIKDYKEIGEAIGIEVKGIPNPEEGLYNLAQGDQLIFIENLSRIRMEELETTYASGDYNVSWEALTVYREALQQYKKAKMVLDFTDMLERMLSRKAFPRLEYLIIDEAQDLSRLQWKIIEGMSKNVKAVYAAGDDDQAIYHWAGADVETFLSLKASRQVLEQSHRIPKKVFQLANKITSNIKVRYPKDFKSKEDLGLVAYYTDLEDVPLETGEWLILARNAYMLKDLEDHCYRNGFPFESKHNAPLKSRAFVAIRTWENLRRGGYADTKSMGIIKKFTSLPIKNMVERVNEDLWKLSEEVPVWHKALDALSQQEVLFFIEARKRGERLLQKPRITISTIHGAKGGEADNVLLLTDMSYRTYMDYTEKDSDPEHRVFYVGVTRTKKALHILSPQTNMYYDELA